jgi:hypothetical protein
MNDQQNERLVVAFENIANGIERIGALMLPQKLVAEATPRKQKVAPAAAPAVPAVNDDIIPGQDDAPAVVAADDAPTVMMCLDIKDAAGLRAFTQKALDAAEIESRSSKRPQLVNELVTFIKGEVCAKFSPTEPKLAKVPAQHAGAAAQMIFDWCLKNKILIQ